MKRVGTTEEQNALVEMSEDEYQSLTALIRFCGGEGLRGFVYKSPGSRITGEIKDYVDAVQEFARNIGGLNQVRDDIQAVIDQLMEPREPVDA